MIAVENKITEATSNIQEHLVGSEQDIVEEMLTKDITLEEAETTEGTILGEEVIATDQTEPELVLIDDSEKDNFHIAEIEPNREVRKV